MRSYQIFFGIVIGIVGIIAFNQRKKEEEKLLTESLKQGQKTALLEPFMLPMFLAFVFILLIVQNGKILKGPILASCGLLFIYINIYYTVILLLLPLLRRIISARACTALWIVPNFLYLSFYFNDDEPPPLFLITLPHQWLFILAWVWATGFSCAIIWQIISHLTFRRFLLKNAEDFTDFSMLALWHSESKRHGVKAEIPVLISKDINTPLTIGCFERTMRLVLPQESYTCGELDLIFRHELRHILRVDTRAKVFTGFCAAICWFNPLGWIVRRKMSDDLELSCDEAVLMGANETMRRQYAELLLKNAGNGRGYTTCLSGAASTLRYRLRNVINPARRFSGGIIIGISLFAIIMMLGTIAVADSPSTVQELVFDKSPPGIAIDRITVYSSDDSDFGYSSVYGWNENPLTQYIASLRVKQVYAGNYSDGGIRRLQIDYGENKYGETISLTRLAITEKLLIANIPYDDYGEITFILEDNVDWEYIGTLLDYDAVNPDPSPVPPEMMMYFNDDITGSDNLMYASRVITSITSKGEAQEVHEHFDNRSIGGVYGYPVEQVSLYFTYAPKDGYLVKVENWERTDSYSISSDELVGDVLPLAPYSAHYTVYGTFVTVRDTVYETEFYFDVDF